MPATEEQLINHAKAVNKHVRLVRKNGRILLNEFVKRLEIHDASKLEEPEHSILSEHFDKLAKVQYGTPEYEELLKLVQPALEAHYSANRHHPQHFPKGVDDFDLIDLIEALCDWMASTKKNKNGNIHRSIEINSKRFNINSFSICSFHY